jgi:hypothetical protein
VIESPTYGEKLGRPNPILLRVMRRYPYPMPATVDRVFYFQAFKDVKAKM